MPNAEEPEAPIVRASRVHLRLERALGRLGIVAKRGFAGLNAMGEPVIDVGVIGASDGERLVDALGGAEADGSHRQQRDRLGQLSQAPADADGHS